MTTEPQATFGSSEQTAGSETTLDVPVNRRILVIDDDEAILTTYRSILQPRATGAESLLALLGENPQGVKECFEIVTATQGQVGVERVREALSQNAPFSVAFVDMRMPPGWDGLRTAQALRALDPNLYIVVASAYADYTADQIQAALSRDAVLLRKPFGRDEVYQLARTLAQGWTNRRALQDLNRALEARVAAHTEERRGTVERRRHLALEQVLAEISTRFAGTCEESLAKDLSWVLERLGQITEADHCYLAWWGAERGGITIHEYCAPAVISRQGGAAADLREAIAPFRALMEAGTMIAGVPLVSTSAVVVALTWRGKHQGLVGYEVIGREWDWPKEDVNLLATSACIVGRVLENLEVARALRENEALFHALAVSAPMGILCADAFGNCIYVNEQAAAICGLAVGDCLGMGWAAHLHPEDRERVWQGWEAVRISQVPFRDEYRFRHLNGTERWVIGTAISQYSDAEGAAGLVGTLTDITELKITQAALRRVQGNAISEDVMP
ncbi:hypothetical protein CCP3SC15_280009 [Gammaproteobacteria bacterium]